MKIILSRKGFDGSTGGCAEPNLRRWIDDQLADPGCWPLRQGLRQHQQPTQRV